MACRPTPEFTAPGWHKRLPAPPRRHASADSRWRAELADPCLPAAAVEPDVDNSGSPSNRPPATNFSATACAMPNSEKMRSRKPGSSSNPRWTRCRRRIAVSTRWSDGGLEAVCRCREDLTSTTTAPTIGRSSQDFRSDAIRTKSSLINGGGQNSCPRSNVFEALGEI
jgi:hypothetical protein